MAQIIPYRQDQRVEARPNVMQQEVRVGFGAEVGQALQGVAKGVDQYRQGVEIFQEKVDDAGAAEVDAWVADTTRQIRSSYLSTQGKNALDAYPDANKAWDDAATEALSRAKNPRQQALITNVMNRRREEWLNAAEGHRFRQGEVYLDESQNARAAALLTDAVVLTGAEQDARVAASHAITRGIFARKGLGDEAADQAIRGAMTTMVQNIVGAGLEANDARGMQAVLDKYGDAIDPAMKTRLTGVVREAVDTADATEYGQTLNLAIEGAGPVAASVDAVWEAQKRQESGNRQFDGRGNLITSRVGAFGVAQLMPDTATWIAQQMGDPSLAAKARTDPAVNERMGKWYMGQQMAKYGLPALALAAYNAGPGRVDQWLQTIGDPRTGEITEAQWAARIPFQETREYVANITARSGATLDAPAMTMVPEAQVRAQARAAAGSDPRRQAAFESAAVAQYRTFTAGQNDVRQAARDAVQAFLPLGSSPLSSWTEIARQHPREWNALDPEYQNQIRGIYEAEARRAEGGPDVETDPTVEAALLELRYMNPQRFASKEIDLNTIEGLSDSTRRSLFREQLDIRARPNEPANSPIQTAFRQARPEIERQAKLAGIDPDTPEGLRELNGLYTYSQMEIQSRVSTTGAVPTRDEVIAIANRGMRNLQGRRTGGLFGIGARPEEVRAFSVIVPAALQPRIVERLRRAAPGVTITPDDVREAYMDGRANGLWE